MQTGAYTADLIISLQYITGTFSLKRKFSFVLLLMLSSFVPVLYVITLNLKFSFSYFIF